MSNLELVPPSADISTGTPPCFEDFWTLYPRHVAKLAARKAWAKVDPGKHVAILVALVSWRQVWRNADPEYLPHGATWLNGQRWEDELPVGYRQVTAESTLGHQIGAVSVDQTMPVRQSIPAHIQAVIDRLTGKKKPA